MTAPPDTEAPDGAERLLRAIRQIVRRIHMHSRALAAETGLTLPQLMVLRAVRRLPAGSVTLAAVSDDVNLSRSTVSAIVERLVKAGLLTRERGATDRRRIELALTDPAAEKLAASPRPLQDRFLERLGALDADEQEHLTRAMEQVAQLMDADELEVPPSLNAPV